MSESEEKVFPLIKVHGSNYEMGYQHGEKCSDLIKDHLKESLQVLQKKGITKKNALDFSKRCISFGADYAPHLVEELNGIADGASVPREEIYFLNTGFPNMVQPKRFEGCTTFAVLGDRTCDGSIITAQNIDNDVSNRTVERGIVLQLTPKNGPAMLMLCRAGGLYPHGINSEGMTRVGNALKSV